MTWYDQAKCRDLLENSKKHFEEVKVVNFDIIHRSARSEPVPAEILKKCQTIQTERVKQYPKKDHKKILSDAFKTERHDLYFEQKVVLDHLRGK